MALLRFLPVGRCHVCLATGRFHPAHVKATWVLKHKVAGSTSPASRRTSGEPTNIATWYHLLLTPARAIRSVYPLFPDRAPHIRRSRMHSIYRLKGPSWPTRTLTRPLQTPQRPPALTPRRPPPPQWSRSRSARATRTWRPSTAPPSSTTTLWARSQASLPVRSPASTTWAAALPACGALCASP